MISPFQVKSYLHYWLEAVDGHSLHSPFFFDFYTKVVRADKDEEKFLLPEKLRSKLLDNHTPVFVDDLGAGSKKISTAERKIKDIARYSLSSPKFSRLYSRMIDYYSCRNIVELGTSLGVNTLYLSLNEHSQVTTFEGAPGIASVARSTFEFAGAKHIDIREGDISATLPDFLLHSTGPDFVFMDANHRYEPTHRYFTHLIRSIKSSSIIVIDDIHYSEEMQKAWDEIKLHPLVYGSADLYRCGILFFDPSLNKQHVVLQF